MSSMTTCNYCDFRAMKSRAARDGLVVSARHGWRGGTEVFVHPLEVVIEKGAENGDHPQHQYWKAWFMTLPNHCCC